VQIALLAEGAQKGMSEGLFLSIACAEDMPRLTDAAIAEQSKASFLGDSIVRQFVQACQLWPSAAHPKGFGDAVQSPVPTLLLSGDLDPVTPPSWAKEALATLPNGRHLVVPEEAHGVSGIGCLPRLLERFFNDPQTRDFDASCVDDHRGVKFFTDFAGP
jgi:pimeloyl-ACP methyl ester carboxylesterase